MEEPGAEAAAAAAVGMGAAAVPAAGDQQQLLPADVAACIWRGGDVFKKRHLEARQLLDACKAGTVAAYTAAGQPAAIMRGAVVPAAEGGFPLQAEACFFIGQCQASGLQQTGGVLGYRPAPPGGEQGQEQLALEPAFRCSVRC